MEWLTNSIDQILFSLLHSAHQNLSKQLAHHPSMINICTQRPIIYLIIHNLLTLLHPFSFFSFFSCFNFVKMVLCWWLFLLYSLLHLAAQKSHSFHFYDSLASSVSYTFFHLPCKSFCADSSTDFFSSALLYSTPPCLFLTTMAFQWYPWNPFSSDLVVRSAHQKAAFMGSFSSIQLHGGDDQSQSQSMSLPMCRINGLILCPTCM